MAGAQNGFFARNEIDSSGPVPRYVKKKAASISIGGAASSGGSGTTYTPIPNNGVAFPSVDPSGGVDNTYKLRRKKKSGLSGILGSETLGLG